jgi:Polysaccharide lyase 14
MWRENGLGELYAYLPQRTSNTVAFANTPPKTVSNEAYGNSVGRGAFTWATDEWTHVAQRVKLNDIGSVNGEIEVYANENSVIKVTGLTFRTDQKSLVRGAQIQTFFGGTFIWS